MAMAAGHVALKRASSKQLQRRESKQMLQLGAAAKSSPLRALNHVDRFVRISVHASNATSRF